MNYCVKGHLSKNGKKLIKTTFLAPNPDSNLCETLQTWYHSIENLNSFHMTPRMFKLNVAERYWPQKTFYCKTGVKFKVIDLWRHYPPLPTRKTRIFRCPKGCQKQISTPDVWSFLSNKSLVSLRPYSYNESSSRDCLYQHSLLTC